MLKKIISACFSILAFSGLFFALHSSGFAQSNKSFGIFESIVNSYQTKSLLLPKSENEYQELSKKEGMNSREAKFEITRTYLAEYDYQLQIKRKCEKMTAGKKKCIESYDAMALKLDNDYLEALKEVGKIFEERKRKLNEARKNFTPSQMKKTPQKREYKRRVNDN